MPTEVIDKQSPIEELFANVGGARMRYLHAGSGSPLLLVHGLMGYSFSWRFAIPAWASKASVYAVDLLGAGFSDYPQGLDCSLRASAERLLRFMDRTKIEACDVVATSYGGGVSMMAAALAPQRFRRLVLVAPINPWSPRGRSLSLFLSNPLIAPLFQAIAPRLEVFQEHYFRRLYGDTRRIQPGTLEGYRKPLRKGNPFDYAVRILRSWNRDLAELESLLPKIAAIPTLLIWGSLDKAVYPPSAEKLKGQFHNCRLVMMEGIGHLPYEEVPEEFHSIVGKFLGW